MNVTKMPQRSTFLTDEGKKMIWFVNVQFDKPVYVTGLGFTRKLQVFVQVNNKNRVEKKVRGYFQNRLEYGEKIERVTCRAARNQKEKFYIHIIK